ncbi:hypothetical protein [uncultured Dokdonia sp.]|uniref:hypothetical protein n=1 Tax=uncultured Dokdonia sp. TaxID=575653 RepID=UPI0026237F1C|nr:hypothetical protein [uncultured Dokdonia sp.]
MLKQIKGLKGASVLKAQEQKNIQGGGLTKHRCDILPNGSPCRIAGGWGCCDNGECLTAIGNNTACIEDN